MTTTAAALQEALSRLKALLEISQHRRLLQLETALPSATLVVERALWRESVNGLGSGSGSGSASASASASPPELGGISAEVDCLSTNAGLELKALLGEQMSLRLMQANGSYRPWHGYVTHVAQLGSDGGLARYRLQLRPFTYLMTLRRDVRVFLGQRADTIITSVLRAYPQANFRFELSGPALDSAPLRGTTTQFGETDAAFVQRLLSEEGWNWRFEHSDDGLPLSSARAAKHCLVISDTQAQRPDLGPLRFGKTETRDLFGLPEDTITAIALARRVAPNAVVHAAWDPRQLAGVSASAASVLNAGDVPALQTYAAHSERTYTQHDPATGFEHASSALADTRAALALARHELSYKTLHGASAVRALSPGANFLLTEHSLFGLQGAALSGRVDGQFLVLSIQHEAANNLGAEAAALLHTSDVEAGSYRNHFQAVPAAATLVPPAPLKPPAPGPQTALVVGHNGDTLTTGRDLMVRIQLPWQRGASPLPGGLSAPLTPGQEATGHAPGDASASQWVRVSQAAAGANWGSVFLPRVGTEVLVDFSDGDIDRPVITGQLHNGQDAPPWPAGIDSGANHPGTLSGWHSQTLGPSQDQSGVNQWVIDDATGQLRQRLASTSGGGSASPWSELSLGHIIGQGASSAQRGPWLGSGFYAHTDGWASVRAASGLLITTSARPGTYGSAQSTQMDASEAVAQLKSAQALGQALGQAAQAQGAASLPSHKADTRAALQALLQSIDVTLDGKHPSHKKTSAGSREISTPVERFAAPHIVLDTPSTAALTSPATLAHFSGLDTSLTAQSDVHAAAAHTTSLISGHTTSLYTHQGELQALAANGALSLRAHTDTLEILADQAITVTSVNGDITIAASSRIELIGGDSKVSLNGGNIDFITPGSFVVKAAAHNWGGGGGGGASLPSLPVGVAGVAPLELELNHHWPDLTPVAGAPYRAVFADGTERTGTLDASGHAKLTGIPAGPVDVFYGEDPRAPALKSASAVTLTDEGLAADLKKLGFDPDEVDINKFLEHASGRQA